MVYVQKLLNENEIYERKGRKGKKKGAGHFFFLSLPPSLTLFFFFLFV